MLKGKVAIVTGGTRGIGALTAAKLSGRGWRVIAPSRAEMDVCDFSSVPAFCRDLFRRLDMLDALVLNAGQWQSTPLPQQTGVEMYAQINYTFGHAWLMGAALDYLKRAGGCVVGVASTRALIGGVECCAYSMAKAALLNMLMGYAREFKGVRFNCICLGLTATDMERDVRATGGAKPGVAAQPPSAVADAIVGLIESDENGAVLRVVDGQVTRARWVWE